MSIKAAAAAVLGLALAIGVPFALDGAAVIKVLHEVRPAMIFGLAGLAALSGIAKAGKLHIVQRRAGERPAFGQTLAISLASDFAFLTTPAGVGGYMLNVTLLRRSGSAWSTATSVVAAEQALDLVFFALCIPLCAVFAFGSLVQVASAVPARAYAVMGVLLLVTAAAWHGRHRIADFVGTLNPVQTRIGAFLDELRVQISEIARGDRAQNSQLLGLTCVQWIARYGALWWVLDELEHRLPFAFLVVLQAGVLHLAQWTGIPGGGGGADLAVASILRSWLSGSTVAMVLPLWRLATLYVPLLLGLISLAMLGKKLLRRT